MPLPRSKNLCLSLDLGFGNSKFSFPSNQPGEKVKYAMFPSIAVPASLIDLDTVVSDERKTMQVAVDGNHYEVGPDILSLVPTNHTPVLHDNFIKTPEYKAIFYGALANMGVNHINSLVVGLPVHTIASKKSQLKQLVEGRHQVTADIEITIGRAIVLAQPIGGLVYAFFEQGFGDNILEQRNLVIDPGFQTFDWVLANGIKPNPARSGCMSGGVSSILNALAVRISESNKVRIESVYTIDDGLRNNDFRLYGKAHSLTPYLSEITDVIQRPITAMVNKVGDGADVDNIVLVGGGANLFLPLIEQQFPRHTIHVVDDGVYGNVKGYQLIGEQLVNADEGNVA